MQSKVIAWISVAVAIMAGSLTLLIPQEARTDLPALAFHISFFLSMAIAVLHTSAGGIFLWGLQGFKHQLRVAYGAICAGIALLGLAQLQTPLVSYWDLTHSWWVTTGIVIIPFIAPIILLYAGTRRFGRLFEIKTKWTSWWFVVGLSIVVSLAAVGLATMSQKGGAEFLAAVGLSTWASVFLGSVAVVSLKIYGTASQAYHKALRWFAAANAASVLAGVSYVGGIIFLGTQNDYTNYGGTLIPDFISGLLFVKAAYEFKRINERSAAKAADAAKTTIVDVIQFAALQASNPARIDPILETFRSVTAGLPAGEEPVLTPEQQLQLQQTYANIEQYLVSKEPLRQFTSDDVRQKIAYNFGLNDQQLSQILGV